MDENAVQNKKSKNQWKMDKKKWAQTQEKNSAEMQGKRLRK